MANKLKVAARNIDRIDSKGKNESVLFIRVELDGVLISNAVQEVLQFKNAEIEETEGKKKGELFIRKRDDTDVVTKLIYESEFDIITEARKVKTPPKKEETNKDEKVKEVKATPKTTKATTKKGQ